MGPEATVLLMRRLVEIVPARDDADHVPLLVDMNPQVPSRIAHFLEGGGEDPGPTLARMARGLEAAGAEALVMPCNTAHAYAAAIRGAVAIPFLDMVALSAREAARAGGPVGVLGSPALRRARVFDPALAAHGLAALHPADEDAALAAIRAIKAGADPAPARAAIARAARDLAARGARTVLIACSEFSLHADAARGPARTLDTLDVLARAAVAFSRAAAEPRSPGRPGAF